jgi:hypothetical protein
LSITFYIKILQCDYWLYLLHLPEYSKFRDRFSMFGVFSITFMQFIG